VAQLLKSGRSNAERQRELMAKIYYKKYNIKYTVFGNAVAAFKKKRLIKGSFNYFYTYYLSRLVRPMLGSFIINETVDGRRKAVEYPYFYEKDALASERTVEIAYAHAFYLTNKTASFLELGSVLYNYFDIDHTVVDKYENGKGVINKDIVEYGDKKRYKLIISISTIERIGFDEPVREPGKSLKAVHKLISLLEKNGKLLITVPIGYNPEIDDMLINNRIKFRERHFLKRVSILNKWVETDMKDALEQKFYGRYPFANACAFLIYAKS
jgi:hypothetical protein